jgi:hypothetical protein
MRCQTSKIENRTTYDIYYYCGTVFISGIVSFNSEHDFNISGFNQNKAAQLRYELDVLQDRLLYCEKITDKV